MPPRTPRTPRQPSPDRTAGAVDDDAGFSAELTSALDGARRRAVRDGDRQIDTAHLLHSLLEHDPQVRAAFAEGSQLARLLGYLVQRSIGYGLRWQSGVEDSGALPVVTAAVPDPRPAPDSPAIAGQVPPTAADAPATARPLAEGFSPLASAALDHARVRAAARRAEGRARPGEPARGVDLLAAIVADPGARAVEVLTRAGVDTLALRARVEAGLHVRCPGGGSTC
ncbi:Clp protease N-terminal domain-containing protein [Streptomyces sp. NPDC002134]|uniref:Clp protease N-terminal domain-containing protein n=1 Tax=Streptomyces sp. NPDC002134 TaxID=3364632 RepID=UPI0036CCFBD7